MLEAVLFGLYLRFTALYLNNFSDRISNINNKANISGGNMKQYDIKDISLAPSGHQKIEWVRNNSVIIHFCGRNKPWKNNYFGKLNVFYEETVRRMKEKDEQRNA